MNISKFMKAINPIKRIEANTKIEYVIQKVVAFMLIYLSAAIIMEVIIILLFTALGYNFMQGEMPSGLWARYLPLCGFIGFALITILYVKAVEKRGLSDIKICLNARLLLKFIVNFIIGSVLVGMYILILTISGSIHFIGFGEIDSTMIILGLIAFVIQGTTEELMCRGYLQTSLNIRISTTASILISAFMFTLPHVLSIIEMKGITVAISLLNLLLVSILFSLAMIKDNSLASAAGIHVGWNYFLSIILGLQVSGGNANGGLLKFAINSSNDLVTGGNYGIEASIILTPLLILINLIYIIIIIRGGKSIEIQ